MLFEILIAVGVVVLLAAVAVAMSRLNVGGG